MVLTKTKTRTGTHSISTKSIGTKTKSKSLHTRISTKTYSKLRTKNYNDDANANHNDNANEKISIRFTNGKFLSRTKTAYHLKREPLVKDKVVQFIDDNATLIMRGKDLSGNILDKEIFNHSPMDCICENIFKQHIQEECNCNNMKTYSAQGKSGASIHSIQCKTEISGDSEKQVLKVVPLSKYYINLRQQTKKYIFLELDGFTIQTLINTYVYRELPLNTVNIVHSGVCSKSSITKDYGYNLMEEADLGSGCIFIKDLVAGKYDREFNIENSDDRYKAVVNFILQSILIIGHLQSSQLEFFHGDYKPENVFVKRVPTEGSNAIKEYKFNVFGTSIKVKNIGFAVLIADFDRSSISLQGERYNKKYRIISPILFKPFFTLYVNDIITKYGDIDPMKTKEEIRINKYFISNLIPHSKDPTITILRSAGVKLFRDIDLYTFMVRLLNITSVRKFIFDTKIDKTIGAFMSDAFIKELKPKIAKNIGFNETAYTIVDIMNKLNEPMKPIFTDNYLKTLQLLNYRLFR